jgi:hypothetical protein
MSNLTSNKKYHYLYKTVNRVNGKFYYGVHSTNNLEDGYLGSGTALRAAFRKHGKENFELTVLDYFDSREILLEAEKDLISEELIRNGSCYNLRPGGRGGFAQETIKLGNIAANTLESIEKKSRTHKQLWKNLTDEERLYRSNKIKVRQKAVGFDYRTFLGKQHTESTREKMRVSAKGAHLGSKNSQFGTVWITDGIVNKKIKKDFKIPDGWKLGRVLK